MSDILLHAVFVRHNDPSVPDFPSLSRVNIFDEVFNSIIVGMALFEQYTQILKMPLVHSVAKTFFHTSFLDEMRI